MGLIGSATFWQVAEPMKEAGFAHLSEQVGKILKRSCYAARN